MQLKTLIKYLKYSGIWINFAINPFHWRFESNLIRGDELNPNIILFYITFGPINVKLIIDDGSW